MIAGYHSRMSSSTVRVTLNAKFTLALLLAVLVPLAVLKIWQHYSHFYVVFDDAEYWYQSFYLLRNLQSGRSWIDVYRFIEGRPSINFIYGLLALLVTGKGVQPTTHLLLSFFYGLFALWTFLFVSQICKGARLFAAAAAIWIVLQANFFVVAQMFMSELPFLTNLALALFCFAKSDWLKEKKWVAAGAVAMGLSICSRPAEAATLCLAMSAGYVFVVLTERRKKRGTELIGLVGVWIVGLLVAAIWFYPRFHQLKSWMEAGTFASAIHWSQLGYADLVKSLLYLHGVLNLVVGYHVILIAALLGFCLVRQRDWLPVKFMVLSFGALLAAVLCASFVQNEGARAATDRYFLGLILIFHFSVVYGAWRVRLLKFGWAAQGLIFALAVLHVFMAARQIKNGNLGPLFPLGWFEHSTARLALRGEEHWAVVIDRQMAKFIPNGDARIYIAGKNGAEGGIYKVLNLRSLELNRDWYFRSRSGFSLGKRKMYDEKLRWYYDYILLGPVTPKTTGMDLFREMHMKGKLKYLGNVELPLSAVPDNFALYQILGSAGASENLETPKRHHAYPY